MSKAEDRANEIYKGDTPITRLRKKDYCEGYHQAEKDLLENKHETSWRLDKKNDFQAGIPCPSGWG